MLNTGDGPLLAALRKDPAGVRAGKIVNEAGNFNPDDVEDVKAFDLVFGMVRLPLIQSSQSLSLMRSCDKNKVFLKLFMQIFSEKEISIPLTASPRV